MSGLHSASRPKKKRLVLVFSITALFLVVEVVGGILTGSLALLADAGHMLTDVGGLALALFAIHLTEKPASPELTYGYYRSEILAALLNAVVLIGISFYVLYEAVERFRNPPPVATVSMLIVGVLGLLVNFAGLLILRGDSKENLNMKGAYFEVLSDAITSVGVIVGAAIMWYTGWYFVDALISAAIGLFILPRTWKLLCEAVSILLEGTPAGVNIASIRSLLLSIPGVSGTHDIHVWSLTSGVNAMSAHVVMKGGVNHNDLLSTIHRSIESQNIKHITIQLEAEGFIETKLHP